MTTWTTVVYSQSNSVYFEKNGYELTDSAKTQLDNFFNIHLSTMTPEVIVKGYSDTTGTSDINLKLSNQRVQTVNDYLEVKGYPSHRIRLEYFGETEKQAENAWKNRRVDLFINPHFTVYNYLTTFQKTAQNFQIDNTRDTVIYGQEGTIIHIPSNCFITDKQNHPLKIKLSLTEYFTLSDIIANNLSTTTETGELMETAGMIHISAESEGERCQIKIGQSISIGFPSNSSSKDGFDLYSGVPTNNRILWQSDSKESSLEVAIERFGPRHNKYRTHFVSNELDSLFGISVDSLIYFPIDAFRQGICGMVTVNFKVNSKGQICRTFIRENEGLHPSIDNLLVNLIKNSPSIAPFYKNDKKALKFGYSETFTFYSNNCKQGLKRFTIEELSKSSQMLSKTISNSIGDPFKESIEINNVSSVFYSTNTLGWKNCDKLPLFSTKRATVSVNLIPSHNVDFKVFIKNSKIVVPATVEKNHYKVEKLPKGQQLLLVGIKYDNNKIYWSKNEIVAEDTEISNIEFYEVTATELKNKLNEFIK